MIPVTKPYLPKLETYQQFVNTIFERQWLTNNGPLVIEFEKRLKTHLNQSYLLYMSNGTIALQLAIKALELKGDIITTPFSYVATTSSIVWEGCQPVFVDIDAYTLNIDPNKIEAAITSNTSAILATHCFGNACAIDAIDEIARRHKLKVIYDAAHCFGTKYQGKSIYNFGDVSTTSFHATKLMHSTEGGGVFTNNAVLLKRMWYMRNFGHDGFESYNGVGINAKNSEFHAAMGLAVIDDIKKILETRKRQSLQYDTFLEGMPITKPQIQKGCDYNYAYYPILFEDEKACLEVKNALEKNKIYPRRYFYPSLNTLDYVKKVEMPVSEHCASRILCLPLYHTLTSNEIINICNVLTTSLIMKS